MSDQRHLLGRGMAGSAADAISGRRRTLDAAEERDVGGGGSSPPADSSGGMSQAQFSGYGKRDAKKQSKLMEMLRKRDAE